MTIAPQRFVMTISRYSAGTTSEASPPVFISPSSFRTSRSSASLPARIERREGFVRRPVEVPKHLHPVRGRAVAEVEEPAIAGDLHGARTEQLDDVRLRAPQRRRLDNPLIEGMPRMLHLSSEDVAAWVAPMMNQAVSESRERRTGSAAVLERVSEMVFVDAARRYLESLPADASGWLAALRDRHVGKAIGLMHEQPGEPWTIDELGRRIGLSRSVLHERFVELMGQPPMQYLTNWRMQRGASLLREGDATVATIAQEVGYDSEAAFARAFKRLVGQPPAAWRRAQRASNQPGPLSPRKL